jgi:hypothetical protein
MLGLSENKNDSISIEKRILGSKNIEHIKEQAVKNDLNSTNNGTPFLINVPNTKFELHSPPSTNESYLSIPGKDSKFEYESTKLNSIDNKIENKLKSVLDLELGFNDAENYKRRENKQFLNEVFVRNEYLEKLCSPAVSFLVGEKGTGKTAYAVYLANNNYKENRANIRYIRETEYDKFIRLKQEKHLDLSDYTSIWKTILYLLISEQVCEAEGAHKFLERFSGLRYLRKAINEFFNDGFSPEIKKALEFVQNSKLAAELVAKHSKISSERNDSVSFSETKFQTNLLYIERAFELALKQTKYKANHILFIDGVDIRPGSIEYQDYLECVKGLANAIWELNNDIFPSLKDSPGRLRVVLLIRPDIFESLNLQNQNTKIKSNSVILNWTHQYSRHRESGLFKIIDRLLSFQQDERLPLGDAWDHYFPWNAPNVNDKFDKPSSFISFLRWSYHRPRDIVTMLDCLQRRAKLQGLNMPSFGQECFDDSDFKREYSDYLLGELKDQLSFYYTSDEYQIFLNFFKLLNGNAEFTYSQYLIYFQDFKNTSGIPQNNLPAFMASPELFLQFLYDLNVICYLEYPVNDKFVNKGNRFNNSSYVRWCFRERSFSNIAPRVKLNTTYNIFYGLRKALNVGSDFMV